METAAVYYESKIKTYGFQETSDLSLFRINIQPDRLNEWSMRVAAFEDSNIPFKLVLLQNPDDSGLHLFLLSENKWESDILNHFMKFIQEHTQESIKVESPVEMVYFHGPHYGDRYGIAHYVFQIFAEKEIPIIVCACSGAAVYLVMPCDSLKKARPVLTEAFEIPKSVDDSIRYGKKCS